MSFCFIVMTRAKITFFFFRIGDILQIVKKIAIKNAIRKSIQIILVKLYLTPEITQFCGIR